MEICNRKQKFTSTRVVKNQYSSTLGSPIRVNVNAALLLVRPTYLCFLVSVCVYEHCIRCIYCRSRSRRITTICMLIRNMTASILMKTRYVMYTVKTRSAVSKQVKCNTHNTLNSSQPAYLHSLLSYHTPARSLRSSNTNLLSVPHVHTTFASRGFSVAAPSVWNSLPVDIHACSSPHTFRRLLKTHCFKQAFSSP